MIATTPFPFADLAEPAPEVETPGDGEPALQYTEEDLARAVEEARQATAIDVENRLRAAMADDIEQRRCDLLAAVKEQIELQASAYERELASMACISRQLAVALADVVIPRAVERYPLIDITDLLKNTLARLVTEPSVELRLPPDLVEEGTTLLAELAEEVGFKGEMTTIPDPTLSSGDVQLRWQGGVVDRCLATLKAEAEELVDRWAYEPSSTVEEDDTLSSDAASRAFEAGELSEIADEPDDQTSQKEWAAP